LKLPKLLKPSHLIIAILLLIILWVLLSYLLVPDLWKHHEYKVKKIQSSPKLTTTSVGIPGDPLNFSVIGNEQDLIKAMLVSGWYPADPITLKSSLKIALSTLLHRPYTDAPVSHLYLFGRKEDLAFEKPVGHDARERHHVRFWLGPSQGDDQTTYWLGAVTFDRSVGFSHTTGQITHHIAPDIDVERDGLIADLQTAKQLSNIDWIDDFQNMQQGKNGGGDPWHTDGRMPVVRIP
jgi:hypothetical protein